MGLNGSNYQPEKEKSGGRAKKAGKIWWNGKIVLPLHAQIANGALDEWLSQRSAKPSTAVRIRHAPQRKLPEPRQIKGSGSFNLRDFPKTYHIFNRGTAFSWYKVRTKACGELTRLSQRLEAKLKSRRYLLKSRRYLIKSRRYSLKHRRYFILFYCILISFNLKKHVDREFGKSLEVLGHLGTFIEFYGYGLKKLQKSFVMS